MKKINFISVALIVMVLSIMNSIMNVNAKVDNPEQVFYTNSNGVSFTEKQYNYFTEMFWEGYQEYVSIEEFNKVNELDLFDKPITKTQVSTDLFQNSGYGLKGTSVTQDGRTTTISKSCSSQCFLSLVTVWNVNPYIKSWDVFGVRTNGTNVTTINSAIVTGAGYSTSYSNPRWLSNGFGYSVQLPNTTNLKATVSFYANTGGTIYATYQHAISNTTESTSKLYLISVGGYGGVFSFYGNAYGVYDGCSGVNITT